ncbi:MAG: hemolysin family protein [Phycisphaerales bacterium]|jgi:CBS domain containing-hemolysin-like protein|nr:hemolysin family protein [Phycisphaerales bacterium]
MIALLALAMLAIATWMTSMERALRNGPRGALLEHLTRTGRTTLRDAIEPKLDGVADVLSLKSRALQMGFLAAWVWSIAGWTERETSHWVAMLIVAGATAVPLIWMACSVLAPAIARWAGKGLLKHCLWVVRLTTIGAGIVAWIPSFISEVVRRLSGAHLQQNGRAGEAEAELLRSIEAKQREGELAEGAATLLENVVDFSTTDVGEVMTPRIEIEGIQMTDDLAAIRTFILDAGHSRIPVFEEDLDHISGILYVKDLIPFLGAPASEFRLGPLLRRPIVVPETKQVADLLADFQQAEVHMAIVVDEYGGTAGLATIEDVLEEIVGEIYDEHEGDDEDDEPELVETAMSSWEVDGRFHIDDFNEAVETLLPEDDEYDTVGGWFTARIGRVPVPGEHLEEHGLVFTVLAAEPTHVTRLKVARAQS